MTDPPPSSSLASTVPAPEPRARASWWQSLHWAAHVGSTNKLAVALAVAATASGMATYAALTGTSSPVGSDAGTVLLWLTLDLVLLLLLGVLVARRIVGIWARRRRGIAGSRLHVRLVVVFSLLAVAPTILVALFSAIFYHIGVQAWFSERVRTAINESLEVAQAYLREHQQNIRADAIAMANDLNQEAGQLSADAERFGQVVGAQAALRVLDEALVFDHAGRVLARSGFTFALELEPVPKESVERARQGDVVLMLNDNEDRVRALIRLDHFFDNFLIVGRLIEPRVLAHMETAQGAVRQYAELEGQRSSLAITLTMIFVVVALLLLLVAVWLGLNFASRLAHPISALIGAAERVRAGDLTARVPEEAQPDDELASLSRAFNRMTHQLDSQRQELVEANRQLDLRRRFTEAVLAGVSAGVIGLDPDGRIHLPNASAVLLLGVEGPESLVGHRLEEVAPEMSELLDTLRRRPGRLVEGQVQLRRMGGSPRMLLVRISAEVVGSDIRGFVVTFDDVTELASAQRKAAWADVARRIAHEIKNPLTPIQLSAERLRRKYLREITSDPETFQICTDTIVRQVDDIRRMVDEFSAFARMPAPVIKPVDVLDLCRQAMFLQTSAHHQVDFRLEAPSGRLVIPCDGRQVSQALTNLLQNALDAIEGRPLPDDGAALPPGAVLVRVLADDPEQVTITIADNGKGLPTEERDRLTEPYVTTRSKGTGLGLAIVKKIMEDHGGALVLEDRPDGGACVSLVLPRVLPVAEGGPPTSSDPPGGSAAERSTPLPVRSVTSRLSTEFSPSSESSTEVEPAVAASVSERVAHGT